MNITIKFLHHFGYCESTHKVSMSTQLLFTFIDETFNGR